ncbi:MAG TPA: hypothetical protein VFS91_04540 [Nitrobacter sp.]|nr:hypothetical protein [Nitrobacter sp.]
MALTSAGPSFAGSSAPVSTKGLSAAGSSSSVTDLSAARRHHRHRGGGDAAAAAAFAGIIGTVGAIAASQARRDAYYDGPGYYDPPPVYYGGPRYPSPYGGAYGYGGGSYLDPAGNIIPY